VVKRQTRGFVLRIMLLSTSRLLSDGDDGLTGPIQLQVVGLVIKVRLPTAFVASHIVPSRFIDGEVFREVNVVFDDRSEAYNAVISSMFTRGGMHPLSGVPPIPKPTLMKSLHYKSQIYHQNTA